MKITELAVLSHGQGARANSIARRLIAAGARALVAGVVAAGPLALFTPPVFATPAEGVDGPILGRVVMTPDLGPGAGEAVAQRITIAPGGTTGWHSHPGPAIAVITAGTLTLYDGMDASCQGRAYGVAQGFVDPGRGHVHIARNEGTTPVEVMVTYLEVPTDGSPRVDAADPGNCTW